MARPVIIDYDIGFDWDDVAAHLLATRSPEFDVVLILTNDEAGGRRARLARRLLQLAGLDIPVAAGIDLGNANFVADALLPGDSSRVDGDWQGALLRCLREHDEVDYLGLGAMSNLAAFITEHPGESRQLRVLQMGGSVCNTRRRGGPEHNVALDPGAHRAVLRSGLRIRFVLSHTTNRPEIEVESDSPLLARLRAAGRPEFTLAAACFELWARARGHGSYLHDPLTCAALIDPRLLSFAVGSFALDPAGCLHLTDEGRTAATTRLLPALDQADPLREYLAGPLPETLCGEPVDLEFCTRADYRGFWQLLEQRLFG